MEDVEQALNHGRRKRVFLMFGSGGGGHKASADAVKQVLGSMYPHLEISAHNASAVAGVEFGDRLYNKLLEMNWTPLLPLLYMFTKTFRPLVERGLQKRFEAYWGKAALPDAVISFVPFLNSAFCASLPQCHHLTVMTDFTHSAAHPWLQSHDQLVFVGTEEALRQASQLKFPSSKVIKTSGMVVGPAFYEPYPQDDIDDIKALYNLDQNAMTFMIFFGAFPPTDQVLDILVQLDEHKCEAVNTICICGHNDELRHQLRERQKRMCLQNTIVVGFTKKVSMYMQICDVVVGKPGPGVVSEALVLRKPIILVVSSALRHDYCLPAKETDFRGFCEKGKMDNIMEQEQDVVRWVLDKHVGIHIEDHRLFAELDLRSIDRLKRALSQMPQNRAVYEVAEVAATIFKAYLHG
mmetsp:Transcript_1493/g.4538  ORF Transcript_1493/g.4538 Transcript_1493/m.4538 type:complete len:408 (+) Transcript_1493:208-1431(+)